MRRRFHLTLGGAARRRVGPLARRRPSVRVTAGEMDEWLTIADAARLVGVSAATLRRWDRTGRLAAVRHPVSGYRMYRPEQLETLREGPGPAMGMLGRLKEHARLQECLEQSRLVVITGPPGIGKTTLFDHALQHLPTAVCGDCTGAADLASVQSVVATALGCSNRQGEIERRLGSLGILGLDNVEQLIPVGVATLFASWLAACPELKIVATSREPLQMDKERIVALGPLDPAAAARLFERASSEPWPDDLVAQLFERVEGNPLAMKLAASQTDLLGPKELLARFDPGMLRSTADGTPERHSSIQAAVQTVLDHLSAEERRALSQLMVFQGGFEAVAAAQVVDVPEPFDVLRRLIQASVLRSWTDGDSRRHAPWAIVRDVVLALAPPASEVVDRHAEWLVERLTQDDRPVGFEELNFRAALAAPHLDPETQARVFLASWSMLRRIPSAERIDYAAGILRRVTSPALTTGLLQVRGNALMEVGRVDESIADFTRSLSVCEEPATRAGLLQDRSLAQLRLGETQGAQDDVEQAMALCREHGLDRLLARALNCKANLLIRDGAQDEAIPLLRSASQLARHVGSDDLALSCDVVSTRLQVQNGTARLADAQSLVALSREFGVPRVEGYCLESVGTWFLDHGRYAEAIEAYRQARTVSKEAGYIEQAAKAQVALSVALMCVGRLDEAHTALRQATGVFVPNGLMAHRCRALAALRACMAGEPRLTESLMVEPFPEQSTASDIALLVLELEGGTLTETRHAEPLVRGLRGALAKPGNALKVASDGSTFTVDGRNLQDLSGRPTLMRILAAFIQAEGTLSIEQLVAAGWPDQRLVGDSGARRVRSAIWTLRSLGLRGHLLTVEGGYHLATRPPSPQEG